MKGVGLNRKRGRTVADDDGGLAARAKDHIPRGIAQGQFDGLVRLVNAVIDDLETPLITVGAALPFGSLYPAIHIPRRRSAGDLNAEAADFRAGAALDIEANAGEGDPVGPDRSDFCDLERVGGELDHVASRKCLGERSDKEHASEQRGCGEFEERSSHGASDIGI